MAKFRGIKEDSTGVDQKKAIVTPNSFSGMKEDNNALDKGNKVLDNNTEKDVTAKSPKRKKENNSGKRSIMAEAQRKSIIANYGLSHFYGNRVKLLKAPWMKMLDALGKKFGDKYGYFDKDIEDKIIEYENEFRSIEALSDLITIISKQFANEDEENTSFFEKENGTKYVDENEFSFSKSIGENFVKLQLTKPQYRKKVLNLNFNVIISKYIEGNRRPTNVLYENLIIEIMRNFFNCSKSDTLDVYYDSIYQLSNTLIVDCNNINEFIYFRNDTSRNAIKKITEEWKTVGRDNFSGAILYLNYLLEETKTGRIIYKHEQKNNDKEVFYYYCGLILNGLSIKKSII